MKKNPIFVGQPSLPPLNELIPYLEKVWDNKMVSNNGPFHEQFEDELCKYLGVPYVSLVSNGTVGLMTALQALDVRGEVITSPYSYAATSQALLWNNLKPVFIDIDETTLNLNPENIENAITSHTSAIMPVHAYGTPCDTQAINNIAEKHKLKVIYDAAHAFGVEDESGSILKYGNLSVLSFHATKVFNTFEGGAIVCKDLKLKKRIDQVKNFGKASETDFDQIGFNAKMNEFSSVLGLLNLKYIDADIKKRRIIDKLYREALENVTGVNVLPKSKLVKNNYSYFPIFIDNEYPLTRDQLYFKLQDHGINGRRYFYPLITDLTIFGKSTKNNKFDLSVARNVTQKVICLPIFSDMDVNTINEIENLIKSS